MSKAKISEDMLTKNAIPKLDFYKLKFDKQNPLSIYSYGKFYKGKYDNKDITLKVVDITINQNIMNEFILWKNFQKNEHFLKLKGIILYYNEAYIIFEDFFQNTLQTLLEQNKLNYNEKIDIAKQILNILNSLNEEKKVNGDLRPGTLVINSDKKIKIIDLGLFANNKNLDENNEIENIRIRYSPPEYIDENIVDKSYDIYSFGCILIDLFAKDLNETVFINKNKSYEEYISEIKNNKFPIIPNNVNYLLYDIVFRCLIHDPKKRIRINELVYNLNILLDYLREEKINLSLNKEKENINDKDLNNNEFIENEKNKKYKEFFSYSKNLNKEVGDICNHINKDLQSKILNMKNDLLNKYDNSLKELDSSYKLIKEKLDNIININKKLIESFYHKILNNIYQMQNLISSGMSDLLDIQNQAKGIQYDIYTFNKFINQEKYENILKFIEISQKEINKTTKKYTNKNNFDLIDLSCDTCLNLVKNFTILTNDFNASIKNELKNINEIKGLNNNDSKIIKELGDELFLQKIIKKITGEKDIINDESNNDNENNEIKIDDNKNNNEDKNEEKEKIEPEKIIKSMKENIYAKVVENNNMITIFNYYLKSTDNYTVILDEEKNNFKFNSNCFSLYDKENNCIYVSGGLIDIKDENSHDNSLYKINIDLILYNKNENKNENNIFNDINNIIKNCKNKQNKIADYKFKIENLSPMNNKRSYHSMLQLSTNKNILLCIGGINTETCEVYNIEYDSWESISDLPKPYQNPGIIDINDCIYVFPYSEEFNNVYKLDMNNPDLIWESIKFSIDEGKIKKGMSAISIDKDIFLLGGYDKNDIYNNIYQVNLNNEFEIDIKLSKNLVLPNKSHFNSNYIKINKMNDNNDKIDENNKNESILIMDNYNIVIEFDFKLGEFYYYLK